MTAPATVRAIRQFPLSDMGNAERLAYHHGKDLRWVDAWKTWLVWDGARWVTDETGEIVRRGKDVVRLIFTEAAQADDNRRAAIGKWAIQSEKASTVRAMLELARSEPGLAIRAEALDTDPWLLNVANGTLDLKSGQLRPADRDDLLTKRTAVPYDPDARCPRWEAFLLQVFGGDVALIDYVQKAVGYSLTGLCAEHVLHLLHGSGRNGKSTFLEVMAGLFGEYGAQADFTSFLDDRGRGPREDIARLAGARLVRSSEVGEGRRLNESLIKSLTGGDTIAARHLFAKTFEFKPQFSLWLAANHKPVIRGSDHAIWSRIRLIPFTVTIPDDAKDPYLLDKLTAELPGILAWAVEGCRRWQRERLVPPAQVDAATAAYRTESDTLGAFLEDSCEQDSQDSSCRVSAGDLYAAYQQWAKNSGEYELSQTMFGRRLSERGFDVEKIGGLKYRKGLRLREYAVPNGSSRRSSGSFGYQDS